MITNKIYTPGQIVTMADIEFVVLDDFGDANNGERFLFLLALKSQGDSIFGCNNYAMSCLKKAVDDWPLHLLWMNTENILRSFLTQIKPVG